MQTAPINITQRLLRQDAMPPLSYHHLQRPMSEEEGEGDGGDAIVPQHKEHFNQSFSVRVVQFQRLRHTWM